VLDKVVKVGTVALQGYQIYKNVDEGVKLWEKGDVAGAVGAFGAAGVDGIGLLNTLQEMTKAYRKGQKPAEPSSPAPESPVPKPVESEVGPPAPKPVEKTTAKEAEQAAKSVGPEAKALGSAPTTTTPANSPLLRRYLSESGGRWGGTATRQLNHRLATDLETRGFRVTGGAGRAAEEWIPGPGGGARGGSWVDITATNGTQTTRIQTVTTLADGVTPTATEAAAAARIRAAFPNDTLILVSKQTGLVIP
jgi:hypothetical protein